MKVKSKLICELGSELTVRFERYQNGRLAIRLVDESDEFVEPVAMATVNLPNIPLKADMVAIKDWSENEGMVQTLLEGEVIEGEPVMQVATGFVVAPVYKLTTKAKILAGIQ